MKQRFPRAALLFLVALGCFDPLYELGLDRSWTVCCRSGQIDTCECVDEQHCSFALTACAAGTCVERGMCMTGTGGGTGGTGGNADAGVGGSGGGSGTGGGIGSSDAGFPQDAGPPGDAGSTPEDGGSLDAGAQPHDAGQPSPDAGTMFTLYEPCCVNGRVTSCECPSGFCSAPMFRSCSQGHCAAASATCPP